MKYAHIDIGQRHFIKNPSPDDDYLDGEVVAVPDEGLGIIRKPDNENEELEVNFTECAQKFLSSYFLNESGMINTESFDNAGNVVKGFLDYLIRFEVCPEYLADVVEARKIAELAEVQLPACKRLAIWLPNKRDLAASIHYGGRWVRALDIEEESVMTLEKLEELMGITKQEVQQFVEKIGNEAKIQETKINLKLTIESYSQGLLHCINKETKEKVDVTIGEHIKDYKVEGIELCGTFAKLSGQNGTPWVYESLIYVRPTFYLAEEEEEEEEDWGWGGSW